MGNHHSVKRECLHEAIRRKDVKKVKQIVHNSDTDFIKNDFKSLELATLYNLTEVVELLLNRGCVPRDKRTARAFDLGNQNFFYFSLQCFVLLSSCLEMS
jgi:hypothetical protein